MPKTSKPQVAKVLRILKKTYPIADCALTHESAFQLLAATILSAQCTDKRVNIVTPDLFARFPNAKTMAKAKVEDVETLVRSTGFFRNKAKNLVGMAKALVENHHGEVPSEMKKLVELPGVARKTANVVLGTWFDISEGVVVDTHVTRISQKLGLTSAKNATAIEKDLMQLLPKNEWIGWSHRIILHGRQICIARRPKCSQCPLKNLCPSVEIT